MADPLIEAAQTLAPVPAKTNFFDPIPGESITARYAGSRRVLKDMGETAEDEMRLRAPIEADRRIARDIVLEDREDQDYFDKQEARNSRGAFLDSISKLDPEADDYDAAVSEVVGGMPPGVMEDDAVRAIIGYKNGVAAKAQAGRQKLQEIAAKNEGVLAKINSNQLYKAAWEGMTQDDRARHTDAEGNLDQFSLASELSERARQREENKFDRRQGVQQKGKVELQSMRSQAAAEKKLAKEVIADVEAFPRRVEMLSKKHLMASGKPMPVKNLITKDPEGYMDAKMWDAKIADNEANAAREMEEGPYVMAAGEISEGAKEKRRVLWRNANAGKVPTEEVEVATEVVETPVAAPVAAPGQKKPLDAATAREFKNQAGGDLAKARKMALDAGYEF